MFTKNNMIYAEPYKCLKRKNVALYALQITSKNNEMEDFEELNLPIPLEVSVSYGNTVVISKIFSIECKKLDYISVKTRIIKYRYSDDDQMALILNKDRSEEDLLLYNKMQQWRDFAGEIAKKVENFVQSK